MERDMKLELATIIEALLTASASPLSSSEIARLIRTRVSEAEDALNTQIENGEADSDTQIPQTLQALAKTHEKQVTLAIAKLNHHYESTQRAFLCSQRAKGWQIFTRPEYADFVRHLFTDPKPSKLSGPAMETLAIIAYRQPVTKASLEAVRGVSCDGMLQKLLDRNFIKVGGRAPLPGRPLLYQTTDLFFEHFGIKSIDELPNVSELRAVSLPDPILGDEETSAKNSKPSEPVESQLAFSAMDS